MLLPAPQTLATFLQLMVELAWLDHARLVFSVSKGDIPV